MKGVNCCASCHHAPVEVFRRRKRMNSARSVKGKVCATEVQQGLMPVQEVYREYSSRRPNTFQWFDAKRRFCPVCPPRCTGGSFNREFVNSKDGGARSLGENECVGSFRVSTSLPNTSPRLSSFASFFYFLSRCRQKIGAKRNDLATADLKKGLLDWLPSSPVVVNEPGQGSTEN